MVEGGEGFGGGVNILTFPVCHRPENNKDPALTSEQPVVKEMKLTPRRRGENS